MDSVEHGYFADSAALEAMLKNHVIWVPTPAATETFIGREGFDSSVVRQIFDSQPRGRWASWSRPAPILGQRESPTGREILENMNCSRLPDSRWQRSKLQI